ncbi:MAG: WD40 repeat domain-containing serine/threonine protein kinase [Verrucomicrobiia bacterium]
MRVETDATPAGEDSQHRCIEVAAAGGVSQGLPTVPDHTLLRCIGRGAYGAVWLARNVMGTYRAVKIVHREDFARARPFAREYEGLLRFEPISRSHPNLMQVLHVGQRQGYFYYVTELADDAGPGSGVESLMHGAAGNAAPAVLGSAAIGDPELYVPRALQKDLELRGRLPVRECVSLATALGSALKHLHDHALVHRDVKPSNVIFVHGVPKLADIGLVASAGDSHSIVGTEGYLPPEGPGSAQADLYALGKLLYEASTGMSRCEYPRLPQNLSDLPDAAELLEFNEVLLRACAKDTNRRYRQAGELLADLALLERGASIKRLRRLERHHVLLRRIALGVLALGLVISAAWWQTWRAHRLARRHLVQLQLKEGTQRIVQGEYATALPWLVGAMALDAGNPNEERVHRMRIAGVLERCPRPIGHFSAPDARILSADIDRSGGVVATAHEDGFVRLWNTVSGMCVRRLSHSFPVVLCRFLPSGDRLLAITTGQKAFVWNLAEPGSPPLTFDQVLGFDSDGYSVGLNSTLGWAYLSKGRHRFVRTNAFLGPWTNLTLGLKLAGLSNVLAVGYSVRRGGPDGSILSTGEFLDSPGSESLDVGRESPPAPVWGRIIVMLEGALATKETDASGKIVWDALRVRRYRSGSPPPSWQSLEGFSWNALSNWFHTTPLNSTSAIRAENGQLILSYENLPRSHLGWLGAAWRGQMFEISPGCTLELEADLASVEAPFPHAGLGVYHPLLAPLADRDRPFIFGGRWLVFNWMDGTVRIWDLENRPSAAARADERNGPLELRPGRQPIDLDLSSDAKHLACVVLTNRCSVWDLEHAREIHPEGLSQLKATGTRFSPDNRYLAVSHADGLELIRTEDWSSAHSFMKGEPFQQPRFSPKGCLVAAVRAASEIVVWDLGGVGLAEFQGVLANESEVRRIVFSPDGRYLASSSANGSVRLWDVPRGEPFGPPLPGTIARFSADGAQLLLADEPGAWLWDLSRVEEGTLRVPALLSEHRFDRSSSRSMTVEIGDQGIVLKTPTGEHSLAPVQGPMVRVAFCSDDKHVVGESLDLRAWLWDVQTRTLAGPPRTVQFDAELEAHASPQLAVENRDNRFLSKLAALLGGQTPDGQGGLKPVDEAGRAPLFAELKHMDRQELSPDPVKRALWHRTQAESAEREMNWDAAVFHWQYALPDELGARRTTAEAESANSRLAFAIPGEARLAYARQAAEMVRVALLDGRSRWSVILPRPPWAASEMLDLGRFNLLPLGEPLWAGSPRPSFRGLASGVQVLGGTAFDVRGIIRVEHERSVTIPIGRPCRRIHFLQAASQPVSDMGIREEAGRYQVAYANGDTAVVLLRNPQDIPPFSWDDFLSVSRGKWAGLSPDLECALVWSGCAPVFGRRRELLFLTKTTWKLPVRDEGQVVDRLELHAGPAKSVPLVFAITVE